MIEQQNRPINAWQNMLLWLRMLEGCVSSHSLRWKRCLAVLALLMF